MMKTILSWRRLDRVIAAEEYEDPDSSFLKGKCKKGGKPCTPQWQQPYYGKGNKGQDQQFAGKAKGKSKKGKAIMTEDPSATSTTAESASWQGDYAIGISRMAR